MAPVAGLGRRPDAHAVLLRVLPLWRALNDGAPPQSWAGTYVLDYHQSSGPFDHFLVTNGSPWLELSDPDRPEVPTSTLCVAPFGATPDVVRQWALQQVRHDRPLNMLFNIKMRSALAVSKHHIDVVVSSSAVRDELQSQFGAWTDRTTELWRAKHRKALGARFVVGRLAHQAAARKFPKKLALPGNRSGS